MDMTKACKAASAGGRPVNHPVPKPNATLEGLLAASDYDTLASEEDRAWIVSPAVGREIL